MAYLNSNSFYSSFARKNKGSGNLPRSAATGIVSPGSSVGLYPAAPKPPAPAAPSGSPSPSTGAPAGFTALAGSLPPDPAYQLTLGGLTGTRDTTIAGLGEARTAGLSDYGYTETTGPDGKPQIAFDPNNPYSQAALLRKHYQQAKLGNTTSYAAQGQLYAGSLQNAQEAASDSYGQSNDSLEKAVLRFLAANTTAQNTAGNTFNTNAGLALGQSVANAPNNPLYNPASAASMGGATVSGDANGNMAITGGPGGSALVPQSANSVVKLASGWSIVYGPDGKPIRFIAPGGS